MSQATATPLSYPQGAARVILVLTAITCALLELIDATVVNVSLREISGSIGATTTEIAWVVTAYGISNVIIIPLTGMLSNYFGRKAYFTTSVIIFTFSSLMCGMSTSLWTLVFWRFIQGLGGGGLLSNAQTIYNETAIKQILSWGTKEGTFLINGAIIGHPENMPENINNYLRCGTSKDGSSTIMQKTEYLGYNGINSSMDKRITDVSNSDIPKLVTGFSFINSECNPCLPLNDNPDYSCPFKLDSGNGTEVSDIWKILWNLST